MALRWLALEWVANSRIQTAPDRDVCQKTRLLRGNESGNGSLGRVPAVHLSSAILATLTRRDVLLLLAQFHITPHGEPYGSYGGQDKEKSVLF